MNQQLKISQKVRSIQPLEQSFTGTPVYLEQCSNRPVHVKPDASSVDQLAQVDLHLGTRIVLQQRKKVYIIKHGTASRQIGVCSCRDTVRLFHFCAEQKWNARNAVIARPTPPQPPNPADVIRNSVVE